MSKIEDPSGIPEDDFLREGLIDRLSQYLEAQPDAWHMRYNLGVALMHGGRTDDAIQAFLQVLAQAPKHMESLVNLGGIYLSRGQGDEALKAFTKALSVHDFPLVRANLAVAYMQLGHLDEAEIQLRRALEGDQPLPDAWANLGSLLLQKGRLAESVEASLKALEVRPDFAVAHNNLAAAYLELDQKDKAKEHAKLAQEQGYPIHQDLLAKLDMK
jgi:tetratricopeptide (TPR) repeat protein